MTTRCADKILICRSASSRLPSACLLAAIPLLGRVRRSSGRWPPIRTSSPAATQSTTVSASSSAPGYSTKTASSFCRPGPRSALSSSATKRTRRAHRPRGHAEHTARTWVSAERLRTTVVAHVRLFVDALRCRSLSARRASGLEWGLSDAAFGAAGEVHEVFVEVEWVGGGARPRRSDVGDGLVAGEG